jgi:hypothetical protein
VRFLAFPLLKYTHVSGVTVALLIPNQLVRVQILGDVLSRSCGPTATTPVLHAGNDGSIPSGTTAGVTVTLARN